MHSDVKRYEYFVRSMNIPEDRKRFNQANVRWFMRNGAIQNRTHKYFEVAYALARKLA